MEYVWHFCHKRLFKARFHLNATVAPSMIKKARKRFCILYLTQWENIPKKRQNKKTSENCEKLNFNFFLLQFASLVSRGTKNIKNLNFMRKNLALC